MKKQLSLLSIALPVLLMLSGCESTSPTTEAVAEPVVAPAPVASQPVVEAPKVEAPAPAVEPKHCDKHHHDAKKHQCSKQAGKHKGKKGKACLKHCEEHGSADNTNPKHCDHDKTTGADAHK